MNAVGNDSDFTELFHGDDIAALEARMMIRGARLELENQRELLKLEKRISRGLRTEIESITKTVRSHEDTISSLVKLISDQQGNMLSITLGIISIIDRHISADGCIDSTRRKYIDSLRHKLRSGNDLNENDLRAPIRALKRRDPGLLDSIRSFLISSGASGVIGNSTFETLKKLLGI